ncbi:hypothetical protein DdX_18761 [Ditylenchus destructor]|uniref:Uncharacterized protein n=1 Tax=Ditylenchus destructor TaxID=166010 RepID=A0AAD4MKZ1_9BILA|nr:hypothetical protein DdX_18761 [Ditylenchus destructor]
MIKELVYKSERDPIIKPPPEGIEIIKPPWGLIKDNTFRGQIIFVLEYFGMEAITKMRTKKNRIRFPEQQPDPNDAIVAFGVIVPQSEIEKWFVNRGITLESRVQYHPLSTLIPPGTILLEKALFDSYVDSTDVCILGPAQENSEVQKPWIGHLFCTQESSIVFYSQFGPTVKFSWASLEQFVTFLFHQLSCVKEVKTSAVNQNVVDSLKQKFGDDFPIYGITMRLQKTNDHKSPYLHCETISPLCKPGTNVDGLYNMLTCLQRNARADSILVPSEGLYPHSQDRAAVCHLSNNFVFGALKICAERAFETETNLLISSIEKFRTLPLFKSEIPTIAIESFSSIAFENIQPTLEPKVIRRKVDSQGAEYVYLFENGHNRISFCETPDYRQANFVSAQTRRTLSTLCVLAVVLLDYEGQRYNAIVCAADICLMEQSVEDKLLLDEHINRQAETEEDQKKEWEKMSEEQQKAYEETGKKIKEALEREQKFENLLVDASTANTEDKREENENRFYYGILKHKLLIKQDDDGCKVIRCTFVDNKVTFHEKWDRNQEQTNIEALIQFGGESSAVREKFLTRGHHSLNLLKEHVIESYRKPKTKDDQDREGGRHSLKELFHKKTEVNRDRYGTATIVEQKEGVLEYYCSQPCRHKSQNVCDCSERTSKDDTKRYNVQKIERLNAVGVGATYALHKMEEVFKAGQIMNPTEVQNALSDVFKVAYEERKKKFKEFCVKKERKTYENSEVDAGIPSCSRFRGFILLGLGLNGNKRHAGRAIPIETVDEPV